MDDAFGAALAMASLFGGTSLIIWTSMKAKIARIKAEAEARQISTAAAPDSAVLAELKALQQQMAERHNTSHQFDISFDAALERLEGRVNRLETKSAASAAGEPPPTLRNGLGG